MRIPEQVRVGPYTYSVQIVAGLHSDGEPCWGDFDAGKCRLRVDAASHPSRQFASFIHEALHALNDLVRAGLDEEQVTRLAPALAAFLQDNGLLREDERAGDD